MTEPQPPRDLVIGWKAIAEVAGVPESTLRRLVRRYNIRLPKLGQQGRTSPVCASREDIQVIKSLTTLNL